jgi:hypothetical protein
MAIIYGVWMFIKYYPNSSDPLGQILRLFNDIMDKHKDLWALTNVIITKIKKSSNFDMFVNQKIVKRLSYTKEPIFELRIPAGKRRGGVVRIYFAYKKSDINTICFLSGELKRKTESNAEIIKTSIKHYKEVCL